MFSNDKCFYNIAHIVTVVLGRVNVRTKGLGEDELTFTLNAPTHTDACDACLAPKQLFEPSQ